MNRDPSEVISEEPSPIQVLLVEDSESDAFLIEEMLNQIDDFDFSIARSETMQQAKASLATKNFDILLLDLSLPDSSGLSTLCEARTLSQAGIVVLTGSRDHSLRKSAIRKGAQDYLPKDALEPELLRRTIEYSIERQKLLQELNGSLEELTTSEERTRRMFDQSFDGIAVIAGSGRFLYLNPAAKTLFGQAKELLLGKPFGNEVTQTTIEIPRADGINNSVVEIRKRSIDWDREEAWLVIMRDITERIDLEEKLRQAQKLEAIGRLAGGVAHDFNNQLTAIMGFTELALRVSDSERVTYHLQHVRTSTEKSAALTAQLLTFGRKQILKPEPICLNSLLLDFEKMLRRLIRADIEFQIEPAEDLHNVYVDPTHIDQVIMNLVINASDAMPEGGRLQIRSRNIVLGSDDMPEHTELEPGEYVQLEVSDTGVGMDKQTLSQIFEPFFTTKDVGMGTGLGLATVYGIISQSKGAISVSSQLGKGTTFTINLPRTRSDPAEAAKEPVKDADLALPGTILLVEDESEILDMLKTVLEMEGAKVISATNGREALELMRSFDGTIDLLLTDLIMPEMGGKDLADIVRAEYPKTVIVFMSGYTRDTVVQNGILQDGINLIQKPVAPITLVRHIKKAFAKQAVASQ